VRTGTHDRTDGKFHAVLLNIPKGHPPLDVAVGVEGVFYLDRLAASNENSPAQPLTQGFLLSLAKPQSTAHPTAGILATAVFFCQEIGLGGLCR
jgi:hypothetical protein